MEDAVCSYCPNDTPNESIDGDLRGWIQTEYGWKCPECRILNPDEETGVAGTVGTDPLVAFFKEEDK